jgi:hypothetical protein
MALGAEDGQNLLCVESRAGPCRNVQMSVQPSPAGLLSKSDKLPFEVIGGLAVAHGPLRFGLLIAWEIRSAYPGERDQS